MSALLSFGDNSNNVASSSVLNAQIESELVAISALHGTTKLWLRDQLVAAQDATYYLSMSGTARSAATKAYLLLELYCAMFTARSLASGSLMARAESDSSPMMDSVVTVDKPALVTRFACGRLVEVFLQTPFLSKF